VFEANRIPARYRPFDRRTGTALGAGLFARDDNENRFAIKRNETMMRNCAQRESGETK
jgi:hypothetical protein